MTAQPVDVPPGPPLTVAAVQMRSSRSLAENVEKTISHLEHCSHEGARVAVFPECSLTGYFDDEYMRGFRQSDLAEAISTISDACRRLKMFAIVGTPWQEESKLYNSALALDDEGGIRAKHHKVQLAESWPVGGEEMSVFSIDGILATTIICHDERYPELVRLPVLAGARLVCYLSFESGSKPWKIDPYRAQAQARAVENTVYLVHANAPANGDGTGSHGQSRIIDPDGNIIVEASVHDEEVVVATVDMSRATARLAERSIARGPLGDWWRAGVRQVRVLRESRVDDAKRPIRSSGSVADQLRDASSG